MTHYHVNAFAGDGTGVAYAEYVYRRKSDAEDALADARIRAERSDTPFAPEDVDKEEVRECNDPVCIEGEG